MVKFMLTAIRLLLSFVIIFFFNVTASSEIYTLSLHDALPISRRGSAISRGVEPTSSAAGRETAVARSEEHTSELQSQSNLVCRLLLEKKKVICMLTAIRMIMTFVMSLYLLLRS